MPRYCKVSALWSSVSSSVKTDVLSGIGNAGDWSNQKAKSLGMTTAHKGRSPTPASARTGREYTKVTDV